jgi:hypothetical protein
MLKVLRHHPLMVGMVEVVVDAVRYVAIVLLVLMLVGRSRSETAGMISSDPHGRT